MDDELGLIEHNIVQTYYRILKELKETEKKGDPKVTSEAVALMAVAVNQYGSGNSIWILLPIKLPISARYYPSPMPL